VKSKIDIKFKNLKVKIMTQALHTAITSINSLSLEEKRHLLQILDEAIFQAEEENWIEDNETIVEIQQVREEYKNGEYVTFNQYLAPKQP
jgi:hypothetical protein